MIWVVLFKVLGIRKNMCKEDLSEYIQTCSFEWIFSVTLVCGDFF